MVLESYIKDLLYRYDCVVVPNFGGFVANKKSSTISNGKFSAPSKQISFNSLLSDNDGLLANHIARTEKMPYETVINYINFEVQEWINKLLDGELELKGIGSFYLIEDKIQFEPENKINYLTTSFGLSTFTATPILSLTVENQKETRQLYKEQVETIEKSTPVFISPEKRENKYRFLKYAAVFLLTASIIGVFTKKQLDNQWEKNQLVQLNQQQKAQEYKIQQATFVMDAPLPTITISKKEEKTIAKYHIIAGAFRNEENAKSKVAQLKNIGFKASIVGKNKWHLTQVAFNSFTTLKEANNTLARIKKTTAKDAWLLVK